MTTITMIEEAQLALERDDGESGGTSHASEHPASAFAGLSDALPLMAWLSPAFPVGSFAFSHGIEWAVQTGDVKDAETTVQWIGALLDHGAIRNDCILASAAWKGVDKRDRTALQDVADLALALAGSRERQLEASAQGNAFLVAIRAAWDAPSVDWIMDALAGRVAAYPVAVGACSAAHGLALPLALEMFALAIVQNLVSATIRLSTLGHTDGQRVIATLLPRAQRVAAWAMHASLEDLGGAVFRSDIAALRHETQYSRLFRS